MGQQSISTPWWRDRVVYQVYPRSFQDSNGDGIGDLPGIRTRLDYLDALGVGLIWLSPVFASPMHDNGYDISDYRAVAPEFGTLSDLDGLIADARKRDIGVLLDLVVNHTSDEHQWFRSARSGRDAPFRDFYIWRDPAPDGGLPNGVRSTFGGPAWTLDPETGQYYFHQFSPQQPDLNWANPALRSEIYAMMNWWLDRGIAGFRMDVIDLIGKDPDTGITANGPNLHPYLQEMHRQTLAGRDVVTVGETWSATPDTGLLYSGADRNELSMVFQFEHVTAQWHPEYGKWQPRPFDLIALKQAFNRWQEALAEDGWNALFWGNHDLPRAVSKYGDDGEYRVESAKMLATVLHLMKGTPFIYQGEELGMTNTRFDAIGKFRDIETHNMYREHVAAGLSPDAFLAGANENGRDTSRTPMHWDASETAGFTTATPWIGVNANAAEINAQAARADTGSVWWHYRQLIGLRREHPIIVEGCYSPLLAEDPQIFAYERRHDGSRLVVIANFTGEQVTRTLPAECRIAGRSLSSNYAPVVSFGSTIDLAPYEVQAVLED
ncbi:glycoside hydrolase family 13 protein [Cucumibacter marinus]|uniref:glycoside hydrolase family 13 protein n=1 Tax=Cucumibacter marinus TaxID=1121252 RepID=UPI0003FE63D4|nr:alpha-glucosidase [Cucumibacter marinus]